ncbi:MAG: CoA pyrophosphatase [Steroidobacteraceae bacterium]
MAASARNASTDQAWNRLLDRLIATRPEHDVQFARIGAGLTDSTDPRLLKLIPSGLRAAAVLIGLLNPAAEPGILLTVRAGHLRLHAGQIAFPGGVIEAADAGPAAAALREAWEEVGLASSDAQVVGFLPDQIVLTGFRITPVIAMIADSFLPRLDPAEVESCFVLPFAALLDAANERPGVRNIGGIDVAVRDLQFGEHRIWGATAGMLFALRALAQS